jgi:hypothetical protein
MQSDGNQPAFFERLWPSPGVWAAGISFGAALGLIPGPIDTTIAVIVGIVGVVSLITVLAVTTPTLAVDNGVLIAGRAQVPLNLVDTVEILDAVAMRRARGVDLDARAFLCTRAWLTTGAKIVLRDPEDPTPYWLVSSRRPESLAAAVSSGIARAGRHD